MRGWRTCRRRWTPAPPSWRQPWTSCSATPPQVRGRGGRAGRGRVDGGGHRVLFEQELTLLPAGLLLPTTPDCSNSRQLPGGEAAEDCGWPAGRDGEAAEGSIASPPARLLAQAQAQSLPGCCSRGPLFLLGLRSRCPSPLPCTSHPHPHPCVLLCDARAKRPLPTIVHRPNQSYALTRHAMHHPLMPEPRPHTSLLHPAYTLPTELMIIDSFHG